jgi:hypothetical protein
LPSITTDGPSKHMIAQHCVSGPAPSFDIPQEQHCERVGQYVRPRMRRVGKCGRSNSARRNPAAVRAVRSLGPTRMPFIGDRLIMNLPAQTICRHPPTDMRRSLARKSLALNGVAVAVQRAIKTGRLSDQGVPDPTGSIVAPVVGTQQFAPKLRCELDDSRAPRPGP